MLNYFKKNKLMTAGVIVVVLALLYYAFFLTGSSAPALQETNADSVTPVSQSLLVMLNNLNTIKLDGSIFANPAFVSLTDFGVVIPPEAIGRRDPFAPLGQNSATSTASKTH